MGDLMLGLRYAARGLARSPGFTAAAVLTLALGIGANTAIFSLVDGVLLSPLPFADGDRLLMLTRQGDVSLPDGVDWRAASESFEEIALLLRSWAFDLTGSGEPERLTGSVVEPEYFRVLGTAPLLGRTLTADDDRVGGPRVAVISHGLWQRLFASDPEVVGRTLTLSGNPVAVVGVMPPGFDLFEDGVDLWVPAAVETPWAVAERGTNNFDAIGRLAPGATLEQAQAEMLAISTRLAEEHPRTNQGKIIRPLPLREFMVGDVRPALLVLLAAVGLVLLIGSVNLAGLLLARSTGRRREVALFLAVGAGRGRVVGQMLIEGLLLAGLGGALGVLFALWGRDLLLALAPAALPRAGAVGLDARVLAFALAAAAAAGLLAGALPAVRLLRSDPAAFLAGGGRGAAPGRERQRLLAGLVAAEVALSCVLLVGAGLLARTFLTLLRVDLGFDPSGVLTASVVLPESRYADPAAQSRFFVQAVEELAALPGVEAAASVIGLPLDASFGIGNRVVFAGREPPEYGKEPGARGRPVVGDYFRTLGIPIRRGRPFSAADDAAAPPVAIVNERFAREFWPGSDPIGSRIAWRPGPGAEPRWLTIVGVAADVKDETVTGEDSRAIYTPYVQRDAAWQRFGQLAVRTRGEPAALARAVQEAVWAVDPDLPLSDLTTMAARRASSVARERFSSLLLAIFSAAALALALQGIYGALAYAVAQRRREIGVRMALGASGRELVGMIVGRGLALTLVGLALGLALARAGSGLLAGLLFGVEPTDPAAYLAALAILAAAALLGSYLPARRAARVDPLEVLRAD